MKVATRWNRLQHSRRNSTPRWRGPWLATASQHSPQLHTTATAEGREAAVDTCTRLVLSRRSMSAGLLGSMTAAAAAWAGKVTPAQAALVEEDVATQVFDTACQSVVSIVNYKTEGGLSVPESVGTGVVWAGEFVVTNYHILAMVDKRMIPQATKVVVAGTDSVQPTTFSVELAGSDSMHDLAVLRITDATTQLPSVKLGRSNELKVGQSVFAIGNSDVQARTMSAGIVSGLNRTIPSPVGTRIYGAIQTDASNAGNSGGPLLDSSGLMVGLNTTTFTRTGTGRGSGVNFALPTSLLLEIVPSLIVYGNAMGKR